MEKLTPEYVEHSIREIFSQDPEASTVADLRDVLAQGGMEDGDCRYAVTDDDVERACISLELAGILREAGDRTYEADPAWLRQNDDEMFAQVIADIAIQKARK